MTKLITNNRLDTAEQVKAVVRAIAFAINSSDVEDRLRELGLNVSVDEIDASQHLLGRFTVEGGENDTAFIATLQVKSIAIGHDIVRLDESGVDE